MNTRASLGGLLAAWLVLAAGGAAGQTRQQGQAGDAPQAQKAAEGAQVASAAPPDYVISPGDQLDINVWKEPDLSSKVPVRPDGKISMPLLNDVQAAGYTAAGLASVITERLKKYLENPQVTVIVAGVNSQHIYITGEVNHPGTFPLLPGMDVLQALASAGGPNQFANTKKIYVLRKVSGKVEKLPFNYKEAMKGNLEQDVILKPGDTIVVP